jgi:hypothetical protein
MCQRESRAQPNQYRKHQAQHLPVTARLLNDGRARLQTEEAPKQIATERCQKSKRHRSKPDRTPKQRELCKWL